MNQWWFEEVFCLIAFTLFSNTESSKVSILGCKILESYQLLAIDINSAYCRFLHRAMYRRCKTGIAYASAMHISNRRFAGSQISLYRQ
jgi:hypothetical protein